MSGELSVGRSESDLAGQVPKQRSSRTAVVEKVDRRGPADSRSAWQSRFRWLVVAGDVLALAAAAAAYWLLGSASHVDFVQFAAAVTALTMGCLAALGAWDVTVLGDGSAEFTRLLHAHVAASATISVICLALQLPEGRPWAFGVVPLAGAGAAAGRLTLRRRLHRRRRNGEALARVLAVGSSDAVRSLILRTRRAPHHGLAITGACTAEGIGRGNSVSICDVRVLGGLDSAGAIAVSGGYDIVTVAQAPGWTPRRLQRLAWQLEGSGTELFVDPGLMEIAGPRLHVANIDGLPLLRLTQPRFTGWRRLLKGAIDRVGALLILLLALPLMVGLAVAVKRDGGPVLFRQTRVGRDGREFQMIKFRSMAAGSEAQTSQLLAANEAGGPLFKLRHDPRVTPVGRTLRRYSLDELPQLFNVLGGSMSLVGPRPPLPREVADYDQDARRRLLVKPGMTGLWQVSGRSNLSWDETVRMDLRYVENWTIALDVQILLKTVHAVMGGTGAY